jgi:hypothetical protein
MSTRRIRRWLHRIKLHASGRSEIAEIDLALENAVLSADDAGALLCTIAARLEILQHTALARGDEEQARHLAHAVKHASIALTELRLAEIRRQLDHAMA